MQIDFSRERLDIRPTRRAPDEPARAGNNDDGLERLGARALTRTYGISEGGGGAHRKT